MSERTCPSCGKVKSCASINSSEWCVACGAMIPATTPPCPRCKELEAEVERLKRSLADCREALAYAIVPGKEPTQ